MPARLEKYSLLDDSAVTLNALIGNAQMGSISVHLVSPSSAPGTASPPPSLLAQGPLIQALPLGTGGALKGKRLVIAALVLDIRPETDNTSLSVSLSGGGASQSWEDSEKASPGGVVLYTTVIDLL